jgi:hypothetical protein
VLRPRPDLEVTIDDVVDAVMELDEDVDDKVWRRWRVADVVRVDKSAIATTVVTGVLLAWFAAWMKVLERERGGWVVVVDIRSSGGDGKSNKSQRWMGRRCNPEEWSGDEGIVWIVYTNGSSSSPDVQDASNSEEVAESPEMPFAVASTVPKGPAEDNGLTFPSRFLAFTST